MKLKDCVPILFFVLYVYFLAGVLIQVPYAVDLMIGKINNDIVSTNATVINMDTNNNLTISYLTDSGLKTATYSGFSATSIRKKGKSIPITYSKKQPTKIYKFNYVKVTICLFFLLVIPYYAFQLVHYNKIVAKWRAKRWQKKNYDFINLEQDNDSFWYILRVCYEENEKKKVKKILCFTSLVKYLIENKDMDVVPVLVHPKSSEVCIEYKKLEEIANVHKALIQF